MSDATSGEDVPACLAGSPYNGSFGLRLGGLFIILVTSLVGTLFPIAARRVPRFKVPNFVWEFAKYFGAGVIIATAFVHLLDPAIEALGNECLTGEWTVYPWALAICMVSVFGIFLLELFAYRFGIAWMARSGIEIVDTHGPGVAHGPEGPSNHFHSSHNHHHEHLNDGHHHHHHHHGEETLLASSPAPVAEKEILPASANNNDLEAGSASSASDAIASMSHSHSRDYAASSTAAQIIGVAILEFGVVVHSVVIGLTLAVTSEFKTLFVVIIFHQMFEGLGLGTRLSQMPLPSKLSYVPMTAGVFYAFMTPIGMAIGLGVRNTYNPDSATASIVSGILDSISAGILLWTGLVELLAHQFLFNEEMRKAPLGKVLYAVVCTCTGCAIMSLLALWA